MTSGYASESEVTAILQALEERYDLLAHQLDGWCVWPVLRFSVSRALQALPHDPVGAQFSRRELLAFAIRDAWDFFHLGPVECVAKTYGSYHSEVVAGRSKDVFFDDLLLLERHYAKIEVINSRHFEKGMPPRLVPRAISASAIGLLSDRLASYRPVASVEHIAEPIGRCLRQDLGLEAFSTPFVSAFLSRFQWTKRLYRALLARCHPQLLLLGEVGDYAITAAARELGIRVVEFQHGMAHQDYPAMSWSRYALPYKARIALPNRVLLYGPYWAKEWCAYGFWQDEVRSVGSVRVDHHRRMPIERSDLACTLVVTLQGTDTDRLISFFQSFLQLADAQPADQQIPLRIVFKAHPVYSTRDDRFIDAFGGDTRVELVTGAQRPGTFELLKQAHFHLSIYSTCHYEALALGVPTLVLPFTGVENVMKMLAVGDAILADTPETLLQIVAGWRTATVPAGIGERYFTPDALSNIRYELEVLRQETT